MASHNKNKVWFCETTVKDIAIEKESVVPGDWWIPGLLQFILSWAFTGGDIFGIWKNIAFWFSLLSSSFSCPIWE